MDTIETPYESFLEMPLVSPTLRAPFSPIKSGQFFSANTVAVQDQGEEIVETITLSPEHDHPVLEHPEAVDAHSMPSSASSRSTSPVPSQPSLITLAPAHLAHLNAQFETMSPPDILHFCQVLFPNLYQTTAFGLSGLVILDMLANKMTSNNTAPDLIFLDTLHHFPETLDLVSRVQDRYNLKVHTFRPIGCSNAGEFAEMHGGDRLWETDSERYDFVAKVEPQQRADEELDVGAVITGRRRSQGGDRANLAVIEVDYSRGGGRGVVKINPLARWSYEQVKEYVDREGLQYNSLLDRGYRSVGDWHSTQPVAEGEGEREGRWKGQEKTECGIHNNKTSRFAMYLQELARKEAEEQAVAIAAAEKVQPDMNVVEVEAIDGVTGRVD